MHDGSNRSGLVVGPGQSLRARAEVEARADSSTFSEDLSSDEAKRLIHELRVHQIELEMQNTELLQAQEKLSASQERYFCHYNQAPVGYLTINGRGAILEANLTAAKIMGVEHRILVKQPLTQFILPEDQDIFYLHSKELIVTGEQQECDLRMLKSDGTSFWAHLASTQGKDTDGALVYHLVLGDFTERKRAEAEKELLIVRNQQLQKADSLVRMASAIAHNFNNQLQVVSGYLEVALGELPPDIAGLSEIMHKALRATQRASHVSRSMLTYLGHTIAPREPHDLSEICERVFPLYSAVIPEKSGLVTEFPTPGPIVLLNPDHIQQVLGNLINNALEAVEDTPSRIRIAITTVAPPSISTGFHFPADAQIHDDVCACLEICDNGIGISAQDIERIFDPFFTSKFPGRGMGLAVVLGIVRAHEGFIVVESEPGHGSTFRVYLPLCKTGRSAPLQSLSSAREVEPGGLVLLVEDEEMVRDMTEQMLKKMGYSLLTATDGIEAIQLFQQQRESVRFVLCDAAMPRLNGWETLAELRKLAPGLPFILASGFSEAQVMDKTHPEQPQAFLAKPYQRDQLEQAIAKALANEKG